MNPTSTYHPRFVYPVDKGDHVAVMRPDSVWYPAILDGVADHFHDDPPRWWVRVLGSEMVITRSEESLSGPYLNARECGRACQLLNGQEEYRPDLAPKMRLGVT